MRKLTKDEIAKANKMRQRLGIPPLTEDDSTWFEDFATQKDWQKFDDKIDSEE